MSLYSAKHPIRVSTFLLFDVAVIQTLLALPIILYVFDQSPYYKRSYINPARDHVSFYCAKTISNYYEVPEDYLQVNIPKIVRLLRAERIVIGTYTSPDRLEVGFAASLRSSAFSAETTRRTRPFRSSPRRFWSCFKVPIVERTR